MAFDSYLTQAADGTSRITLADGTGSLVLAIGEEVVTPPAVDTGTSAPRAASPYRVVPVPRDDDEIVAVILLSLN